MTFEPNLPSLAAHKVPEWYEDAKFGIFIHWGMWAIPAFASRSGSISDAFRDHYDTAVARTPYTEWYWNAIRVPESESARHHREVWRDAPYESFREPFLEGVRQWRPAEWADLFAAAGARYVVFVTKHHDGYCLWPSKVKNPHQADWTCPRDIVGELAEAVRGRGMKFGVYYSGGIDWTFNREPIRTLADFMASAPGGDYPAYAEAQTRELIGRYRPSVLWNDISWPARLPGQLKLFADYYNAVPEGVINDRWMPVSWRTRMLRFKAMRKRLDAAIRKRLQGRDAPRGVTPPKPPHFDFRTPEYTTFPDIQRRKWEATKGMSHSFGFNRRDTDADYESVASLVHGFIDTVSKNGNLLLNVGPRGEDARIPAEQVARLEGFGAWLKANGEAIYGTRPWLRAEARTPEGGDVRYMSKPGALYVHLLGRPAAGELTLEDVPSPRAVTHLPTGTPVAFQAAAGCLRIALPASVDGSGAARAPAEAFRLDL
ncbi:MAG TPA: alpha-L-fucosidase [Rhizomicrobium sp.]|nr:alpha-L-fucosidase [Rhizomicrobium sp.]